MTAQLTKRRKPHPASKTLSRGCVVFVIIDDLQFYNIVKGHLNDVKGSHLPMQPEPIRKYEEHRNVSSDVRDEPSLNKYRVGQKTGPF